MTEHDNNSSQCHRQTYFVNPILELHEIVRSNPIQVVMRLVHLGG